MQELDYQRASVLDLGDVRFIVRTLAVLEGAILSDNLDTTTGGKLAGALSECGLLTGDVSERSVRQALNFLNHKFRYVLGEYDIPPPDFPLPE